MILCGLDVEVSLMWSHVGSDLELSRSTGILLCYYVFMPV